MIHGGLPRPPQRRALPSLGEQVRQGRLITLAVPPHQHQRPQIQAALMREGEGMGREGEGKEEEEEEEESVLRSSLRSLLEARGQSDSEAHQDISCL